MAGGVGLRFALDSNVVIYEIAGRLAQPLPEGTYFVSVVSKIELLPFAESTPEQERVLRDFLDSISVVELSDEVCEEAILLRKQHRLKLPDAVVDATASIVGAELLTHMNCTRCPVSRRQRPLEIEDHPYRRTAEAVSEVRRRTYVVPIISRSSCSETFGGFSMGCPIDHLWPDGSFTWQNRSPQNISSGAMTDSAPALIAWS